MPKTKARPRHTDLKPTDDACPHCDGGLDYDRGRPAGILGHVCLKCHCHWGPLGLLTRWGRRCPLLVRA